MQEALRILADRGVQWYDILDILAVTVLFCFVFRQVRGTRAVQMLLGVVVLMVANVLAGYLRLTATQRLLQNLLYYVPFAIIVLFSEPIRKILATLGSGLFGRGATVAAARRVARETAQAAFVLARRRYGALIVLERTQGLKDYAETGVKMHADLTADLLSTLFFPGTPLHDGAAVVVEGQLLAAGCFLPLSQRPLPTEYGTRHRAAVGLTEETDAICVVVSEERGVVSVALDGQLTTQDSVGELEAQLSALLGGRDREKAAPAPAQ